VFFLEFLASPRGYPSHRAIERLGSKRAPSPLPRPSPPRPPRSGASSSLGSGVGPPRPRRGVLGQRRGATGLLPGVTRSDGWRRAERTAGAEWGGRGLTGCARRRVDAWAHEGCMLGECEPWRLWWSCWQQTRAATSPLSQRQWATLGWMPPTEGTRSRARSSTPRSRMATSCRMARSDSPGHRDPRPRA